jgi:hypothetical protein
VKDVRRCICGLPLRNNDTICRNCYRKAEQHLAEQPFYLTELETELARATRKVAENSGVQVSTETGWTTAGDRFLDTITDDDLRQWDRRARGAAEAIHEQRQMLVKWVRLNSAPRIPATVPAMSVYLIACLPHLRNSDDAPVLAGDLRRMHEKIVKIIDLPENRTRIHAGPCIKEYCPGQVEAIVPADESIPPVMRCRACKVEYPSGQWLRAGVLIERRRVALQGQRELAEAMGRK